MAVRSLVSLSNRLHHGAISMPYIMSSRQFSNATENTPATNTSQSGGVIAALKTKLGVTGTLTLGIGTTALLLSKELYVVTAETITAIAFGGTLYVMMRRLAKPTADYLDNRSQEILDSLNAERNAKISQLEQEIGTEMNVENVLSVRDEIFDIIKEENDLKREEEYRRRLAEVRAQVKKRLDYQLQTEQMQKQFQHKHIVSWLEENVRQSLQSKTDESIPRCIADLKGMAAVAKV